jgi:hypothetical protein
MNKQSVVKSTYIHIDKEELQVLTADVVLKTVEWKVGWQQCW